MPDSPSPDATALEDSPYRLPRTVVPSRYDLEIEPDLAAFTFAGTCATTVEVAEPTLSVVCNAIELEVRRPGPRTRTAPVTTPSPSASTRRPSG